eukprot:1608439-Pleurochrysis_carterae.AAC.2
MFCPYSLSIQRLKGGPDERSASKRHRTSQALDSQSSPWPADHKVVRLRSAWYKLPARLT